jgi:hypothetical protein
LNPTKAGAAIYIPKLSIITETPSPNTSTSEPVSAKVIMDSEEIIGVINALTTSWNIGFALSMSAIVGENE